MSDYKIIRPIIDASLDTDYVGWNAVKPSNFREIIQILFSLQTQRRSKDKSTQSNNETNFHKWTVSLQNLKKQPSEKYQPQAWDSTATTIRTMLLSLSDRTLDMLWRSDAPLLDLIGKVIENRGDENYTIIKQIIEDSINRDYNALLSSQKFWQKPMGFRTALRKLCEQQVATDPTADKKQQFAQLEMYSLPPTKYQALAYDKVAGDTIKEMLASLDIKIIAMLWRTDAVCLDVARQVMTPIEKAFHQAKKCEPNGLCPRCRLLAKS